MKTIIFFLLIAINLFAINCGDFKGEFATYNGHYYAVTGDKMSFETAKQFAQANGGYIAIPDNIGENEFIKGLVGTNNNAWIGIYDPNYTQTLCFTHNCYSTTRNRFKTIKNTALSFQNWDSTDIENQFIEGDDKVDIYNKPLISLLGEHWALMSGNTGKWRDWGTHFISGENPALEKAIIEFDTKPTCYNTPSTVTDNITGRICNSQIWDSVVGVSNGATAQCLTDATNVEYCPQSLAQCGQSWDYETGYSVGAVGSVTDYTNKVTTTTTIYTSAITTKYYRWKITSLFYSNSFGGNSYISSNNGFSVSQFVNGTIRTSFSIANNGLITLSEGINGCGLNYSVPLYGNGGGFYSANSYTPYNIIYGTGDFTGNGEQSVWGETMCSLYNTTSTCSNGTTPVNGQCGTTTTVTECPAGTTETTGSETSLGQCKTNQNYTYYNYLCNTNGYNPISSGGNTGKIDPNNTVQNDLTSALNSATPPTNNCRKIRFTCLSNPSRPCANVNGQMQCSPFPCMGNSDFENAGTVEGENDKNNAGWQNDGNCAGQLYIFNGEDKRCRKDDKLFGLTGGGCCDKDKVFMGLVSCKENEKMLAKKRNNDLCHYVGSYCSKKLKLGFVKICIQNSESHCCFASKLGRIIHEQGRPQLGIDWGSGDSPICRGFTPNEFQKLDFSKINFDEFAKDIQAKTTNFQNIGGFVQNKVQNFFQK